MGLLKNTKYSKLLATFSLFGLPVFAILFSTFALGLFSPQIRSAVAIPLTSFSFLIVALIFSFYAKKEATLLGYLKLSDFKWVYVLWGLILSLVSYIVVSFLSTIVATVLVNNGVQTGANKTVDTIDKMPELLKFLILLVFVVLLTPVCEEVFFRGAMLNGFIQESNSLALKIFAVILTSIVFGVFHIQGFSTVSDFTAFISPLFVGSVTATITVLTNSLYPAIFAHAFYNGLILIKSGLIS